MNENSGATSGGKVAAEQSNARNTVLWNEATSSTQMLTSKTNLCWMSAFSLLRETAVNFIQAIFLLNSQNSCDLPNRRVADPCSNICKGACHKGQR